MANEFEPSLSPLDLQSFAAFSEHPWVKALARRYDEHDAKLADHASARLVKDLVELDHSYAEKNGRGAFSTLSGRVKSLRRYLLKVHRYCREIGRTSGVTQLTVQRAGSSVKDICGVRIACPYFDEVESGINDLIRPWLHDRGYAIEITGQRFKDKNYLDEGDRFGYRSYHFYVKVPTPIDIFGKREMVLAEVQARSELQHVWAEKSHVLYSTEEGLEFSDPHVMEDFRQVSQSLRVADQLLVSIRDRVRRK